ncbi:MAG: hypothetical protein KDB74_01380 [Flavobacteriales bacterium]|nr:hypothetical protein [Flavobacteriales bacterium]
MKNNTINKELLEIAKKEVLLEKERELIEKYKTEIRKKRSIWDRIFPFTITIERKKQWQ